MSRAAALVLAPSVVVAGALVTSVPAAADCVSSSGTTVCSQGTVRGSDTGQGPGTLNTGPAWPYPCDYDWYCNDGGLSIIFTPGRH